MDEPLVSRYASPVEWDRESRDPGHEQAPPLPGTRGGGESPGDFIHRDGRVYAGNHLVIDIWGARRLDDIEFIGQVLREAVGETGAKLLGMDLHHFSGGGVTGVALLAESHMSIHSWPEFGYAALDVFVCGDCDPARVVPVIRDAFVPGRIELREIRRGVLR